MGSCEPATKQFTLQNCSSFEELVSKGLAVEIYKGSGRDEPIEDKSIVSIKCCAMKWEPSVGLARTFACTDTEPNEDILRFVVGMGHMTEALDLGIREFDVGDSGAIVCNPTLGYGISGLPGFVNSKSFLVYEVVLVSVESYDGAGDG